MSSTRRVSLFLVALTILASASAASAEPLAERLEAFRTFRLSEEGAAIADRTATVGHLELRIRNGTSFPILAGNGEPIGFYFEGDGTYLYGTDDSADRQVLADNLKARASARLIQEDGRVRDTFERLLVLFARPALEELWTGEPSGASRASAESAFRKIWKGVEESQYEYDHFAAQARGNEGGGQVVYAEIEGKSEPVGWRYDTMRALDERLFFFRKVSGIDIRFTNRISNQPVSEQEDVLSRLEHVDLDLSTDDNLLGAFRSTLKLRAGIDGLQVLPLALVNHRDPNAYAWDSKKHENRVLRVTDEKGRDLSFSHRYHELLVELAEPAKKDDTITLVVESEGEILTAMGGQTADNYFELHTERCFPIPMERSYNQNRFTFNVKVRTKQPYRPIVPGEVSSLREDGDAYIMEAASTVPVKNLSIFAGKYKSAEETFDGVTIRVHCYAMARKKVLENLPKLAWAFASYYKTMLGSIPFRELDIIEVPDYGFGIAPAGTVLLTTEAYKPRQDYLSSYFSRGINSRLAHEIAHQWFGHVAVPTSHRDQWISESFAEYLSGLAMAAAGVDERKVEGFKLMFEDWWASTKEIEGAGPIEAANMIGGPSAGRDRFYLLYAKGPLVLRMLHSMVGNEKFFEILRRFLDESKGKTVGTDDFRKVAEAVVGNDLGWFFDQWIGEGGLPHVKIDHDVQASGGGAVLTGTAVQEGEHFKKLIIPLVLDFGGGRQELRVVVMEEPKVDFRFDIPAKPRRVEVDPARNTLALYR